MRSLVPLAPSSALFIVVSLILACTQESRQDPLSARNARDLTSHRDIPTAERKLTGKPLYSQGNEEPIVRDYFRDRRNGFFLDVGCSSPVTYSNTYYLENHLGWSGIAVDALPEYRPAWERERPRSKFFNYLISDHSETVESFYRSELRGISSYRKDQLLHRGVKFEEISVPTITLTRLLEQNGVATIDFLSMDIEGAEVLALAGFDIVRFSPELACVEAKPANREKILEYFAARGYQRIDRYLEYDQVNYYFTPKVRNISDRHDAAREPPAPLHRVRLMLLAQAALALVTAHILPGALLVGVLRLGRSSLDAWLIAGVLGGPLAASIYWASLVLQWPALYWVLLGAIDVTALYVIRHRRSSPPVDPPQTKPLPLLLLLLSVLVAAYLLTTGYFFQLDRQGNFVMDPAFTQDALFHTALVEGLQTSYPPELFSVSGARAYYPLGYHLQVAAWERFFGLDPYDGMYRVGVLWSLGLLVLSAYLFGRRFSKSPAVALAATALLFGGGLGYLFHEAPGASWWSLVFMDATLVSIFGIDPLLPALPLFFVGLACLEDYLRDGHRGALAGSALGIAALLAVKALLAAQILAAVGLAAVLARGSDAFRTRRAALVLALASAPMLLSVALTARHSNDTVSFRPLEIVRYSMETLGRKEWAEAIVALGEGRWAAKSLRLTGAATALWLVGFLGLRLVAARGILRDACSRSGSLRQGLALFVLMGFPLTLLLRIAPPEAAGQTREEALNDAFWFATLSGIVMWFWTAEALAGIARRGENTAALVVGASALLAFPTTVQHFIYKTRLSAESVPAPAVEAARACHALSRPGEVFVEPPTRVRPSVPAYLAGRPVVYNPFVGYNHVWVSRGELDFRRHAVAQFWSSADPGYGSWFLSHYNVRWIYTPQDAFSPQAGAKWATPVFSNDAATVYRVGELQGIPLKVRTSLPLGTPGAAFFGEGWGSPESSPRLRRLMPGSATLYIPLNEAQAVLVSLELKTPHPGGELTLATERADLEPEQDRAALVFPASQARRGLNRLDLLWRGAEPLKVTAVGLSH